MLISVTKAIIIFTRVFTIYSSVKIVGKILIFFSKIMTILNSENFGKTKFSKVI